MDATLDIVGCGRLGTSLARSWHRAGPWRIGRVLNRSLASGRAAVAIIGAGRAVESVAELGGAELILIATPDAAIGKTCQSLAGAGAFQRRPIVFHASGALSSAVLSPARDAGASTASAHPIQSFAEAGEANADLQGIWCGIEGDPSALRVLQPALEALGMKTIEIDPAHKALYHLAAILASNHLVTLLDASMRCYEMAGVPRDVAAQILAPLIDGTRKNVLQLGPIAALTGPVARGEVNVVASHLEALDAFDADLAHLYRALVTATLELSRRQGTASEAALQALADLAQSPNSAR